MTSPDLARASAAAAAQVRSMDRVRLAKKTSNLFRPRERHDQPGLDLSAFAGVQETTAATDDRPATATVGGLTTYEQLVDELLPLGQMPLVVPQLKTITLGGAVTGLGIESTSFRNGLPHESVTAMQILTGTGEVVTATRDNEQADLFHAFPNSYGSLGYALTLTIETERTRPYVALRHLRFSRLSRTAEAIAHIMATRDWDGEEVDFLDGVVFSRTEAYLTLGRWADTVEGQPRPSDYTGQQIYYRSIQHRRRDVLTTSDYLWRWDTDWFWCSRAFGAQVPAIRRLWPRRLLRSDFYWKLQDFEARRGVVAAVDRRRGRPAQERVVQDVEIPLEHTAPFLDWFLTHVPIEPLWLCPVQLRPSAPTQPTPWPLYPMRPGTAYVNVGFWSAVPIQDGAEHGDVNRAIEAKVTELGGHKGLYSEAFYDEATFAALYDGEHYAQVKARYDPDGRFPTLYDKAVRAR
ncbi:FAD-binding oxidoreductase [Ornithinimicrobium cryptoxanthini]|uniref:Delta(24)-sterol reductase n=1 Tax=Ornithinimicrobium cryptoxanthini TaxID=2934161 RepID=A0ABY4YLL0_9MICO|nr:FAD-binding oxidoreductase [Ornithinimicrobium cryptoxanthini]USQ77400.1 FAD-binding oxidoreductase [Ornithinimicrobium cryptoxanthini]